ncbi:hypothetical protein CKAH01_05222 [Colletotrichum kahawae]|uniref:PiggyBac transposable element-derived protein domain-containing protein n=1 Tax=Colletotrichum kahawae TaxID=34407 RepID=A0AAD9YGK3_COLKA|nr:hypothetical protein CKAH01_05222 [Colletotrichum kahawae]
MDSDDSDASETSVRDCITVAVLPEDLAAAYTDSCRLERCDEATVRPHEEPGVEHGTPGSFTPFEVPEREADIGALPATPIDLFLRYVPYDVVDRWAEWTNAAGATAQRGPVRQHSRIGEKEDEGKGIPWGQVHCIPTKDGQINQFTWKDNALVLFLTTVFRETAEVLRLRRRPTGDSAAHKEARRVFGAEARKNLPIPLAIDEYNHNMNGVDTSDQMRSYYQYSRPIRRGSWQALAWNFLLEVVLVNTFFLQLWGDPNWPKVKSQY